MTALAYFLIDADGQETMPQLKFPQMTNATVEWFGDMASSESTKALDRPGFAKLYDFAKKGDFLVVSLLAWVGTSALELLDVFQALKSKGVGIVSMSEGLSLLRSDGATIPEMLIVLAELERTRAAVRIKKKLRSKKQKLRARSA
jgi:putative DNA-invertase from lambdoid prophage Rac